MDIITKNPSCDVTRRIQATNKLIYYKVFAHSTREFSRRSNAVNIRNYNEKIMNIVCAVLTAPPLIRRYTPPSPKIREKAYIASANINYSDTVMHNRSIGL